MMRRIDRIVVHVSATRCNKSFTVLDMEAMHKARGFKFSPPSAAGLRHVGYHYFIRRDGTVETGRPLGLAGAHVQGFNSRSIGICLEGGLDETGKAADTRTPQQKAALATLVRELATRFAVPAGRITGHRDLSPDKDGDGIVERHEYLKECPCFSVADERDAWLQETIR